MTSPNQLRACETMNRALLLYAISRVPEGLGRTQVQKLMFRASLRSPAAPAYRFVRAPHGPFAQAIYDDTDILDANDLVTVLRRPAGPYTETLAKVTEKGARAVAALLDELEGLEGWPVVKRALDEAATFAQTRTATALSEWSHYQVLVRDDDGNEFKLHDIPEGVELIAAPERPALELPDELLGEIVYGLGLTDDDRREMETMALESTDDLLASLRA